MPHTEANRPVMANTGSAAPSEALAGSLRSPWQRCTCHARQIFRRFFPDARMENFLRGHVASFTAWHGVPRILLYDNLKKRGAGTARRCDPLPSDPAGLCRA